MLPSGKTGKNTGRNISHIDNTYTDNLHEPYQIRHTHTAGICILTAAALWGLIGLWNRQLMAAGLSSLNIVVLRNFGGMLLLVLTFCVKDRSVFHIQARHFQYFAGTGIVSVVFFTCCYFTCQQLCSLAIASILLYTAPAFVVVLSAILWKEAVTRRKLWALFLTLFGCMLVCGIFSGTLTLTLSGLLLGLGSGFFYALYSIFGRYALKHYHSMTVTVWTFITAGCASLLLLRPSEMLAVMNTPRTWLLAAGLIIFSTVLPYLLYTRGLSQTEAGTASIMATLEPVVASLTGMIFFRESLRLPTLLGILCILTGVYCLRETEPEEKTGRA